MVTYDHTLCLWYIIVLSSVFNFEDGVRYIISIHLFCLFFVFIHQCSKPSLQCIQMIGRWLGSLGGVVCEQANGNVYDQTLRFKICFGSKVYLYLFQELFYS